MLWHHFAIRLGLALLLGAIVGAERQWRQRMAGLRTNALVAAGAAMFVMLSAPLPLGKSNTTHSSWFDCLSMSQNPVKSF